MAPPPTYPNSSMEIEPGHRVVITLPDSTTHTVDTIEADLALASAVVHIQPVLAERSLSLPTPCPVAWVTSYVGPSPVTLIVEAHEVQLAADLATVATGSGAAGYAAAAGRLAAVLAAAVPV